MLIEYFTKNDLNLYDEESDSRCIVLQPELLLDAPSMDLVLTDKTGNSATQTPTNPPGGMHGVLSNSHAWGTVYLAWGTLYLAQGTRHLAYLAWGTLYLAWGTLYLAWGTLYLARGTLYFAWGIRYLAYLAWGTLYFARGTRYLARGTLYCAWGTLYLAWGTLYLAWGTRYLAKDDSFRSEWTAMLCSSQSLPVSFPANLLTRLGISWADCS